MIVWQGLGFLVVVIAFGCFLLAEVIARSVTGDLRYYPTHPLPRLLAAAAAAGLIYALHVRLERAPGRTVIDKATGREIVLRRKHTLFFVPIRYWSYITLFLGVLLAFVKEGK